MPAHALLQYSDQSVSDATESWVCRDSRHLSAGSQDPRLFAGMTPAPHLVSISELGAAEPGRNGFAAELPAPNEPRRG